MSMTLLGTTTTILLGLTGIVAAARAAMAEKAMVAEVIRRHAEVRATVQRRG